MIRRPPRSTQSRSSAASDVYKRQEQVPPDLKPYTETQQRGRQLYIANGCIYCHSQQPRDPGFAPGDRDRGWGRPSVPGDYAYDQPHLLGTMPVSYTHLTLPTIYSV